jgi:putative ABC transport system permease protein
MFDLEKSIRDWKKGLRRLASLEDGAIAELESHLRDEIDRRRKLGLDDQSAFEKAVLAVGRPEAIAADFHKTNARPLAFASDMGKSGPSPALLLNYLKIAARKIRRQKGYAIINIAGLAVGMACCLLIFLFVRNELSYDAYNKNADRIFRIATFFEYGGRGSFVSTAPPSMAPAVARELPGVEDTVRFRDKGSMIVRFGEKSFRERRFVYADPSLFSVFTIPLIQGDPATALVGPKSIVISESTARKYFGDANPVGKLLRVDDREDYQVTGVCGDIPSASHFHFDLIASLATLEESRDPHWGNSNFQTYLLLREDAEVKGLEAGCLTLARKYLGPEIQAMTNASLDSLLASGAAKVRYTLQPLKEIHLTSKTLTEFEPNGSTEVVYIFSAIALFVLLIAGFNFVNLSTARSAGRAREAGLRKVLGSERSQLVRQFLVESILTSSAAMAIGLVLASLALPWFNNLAGKDMSLLGTGGWVLAGSAAAVALMTGLLAGAYPALLISRATPALILKGKLAAGAGSGRLRGALVVLQFTISVVLLVGTAVVAKQLRYIQNRDLGYRKEQVLILNNAYLLGSQAEAFKDDMLKNSSVLSASISGFLPVPSSRDFGTVFPKGEVLDERSTPMQKFQVDHDYIRTLGMKITAGRDFSRDFSTDSSATVINRAAARQFGWPDPVGKEITIPITMTETLDFRVIGVVEDFNYDSLKSAVGPLVMVLGRNTDNISFRFEAGKAGEAVRLLRDEWNRLAPGQPFEYSFLDERFSAVYESEEKLGVIFGILAGLAIFVACLGLLGLASYLAEQRTKEIGIRKVLGASAVEVIGLLLKEFAKWIVAANLIAWPLAYFAMRKWLEGFAFRTGIGIGVFLLSGLTVLAIALLSVGYQAVRAALANPVDSLHYE